MPEEKNLTDKKLDTLKNIPSFAYRIGIAITIFILVFAMILKEGYPILFSGCNSSKVRLSDNTYNVLILPFQRITYNPFQQSHFEIDLKNRLDYISKKD